VCLGFLHGAILGWIAGYFAAYFSARGSFVRRVYLDALKHYLIALVIVIAGLIVFFSALLFFPFPERVEELYYISFGVSGMFFFFARLIKIEKAINRYDKNWPQSVGRLETISYGSKRFQFSCLAFVIVLLMLLVIG
jgi:hypothetical protein